MTVAGHPFALGAVSASQWLGAIAMDQENLAGIMPGLIADDDLDVMEQIMQTHPDVEQRWTNAARMALQRAGGRDWWWTLNLAKHCLGTWIYTNGLLLRQGVDSRTMGLPDWLDACYTLYWQNASEQDQMKLDMQLSVRPKGVRIRQSRAQMTEMVNAFAAD